MSENQHNGIADKFAVLVVSCDKYADLWEPFFDLFWRYWPDCPFNVYLLSNHLTIDVPRVKNVPVGDDLSWSDNLKNGLKQLSEEHVLLFIDDLFLCRPVRTEDVREVFCWAVENRPNHIRMNCYADNFPVASKPDKPYSKTLGIISKGADYRVSTVLTVWRRDFLQNFLVSGENAWEFETKGSVRSDEHEGFFSTYRNYFPVVNGVIRGKWRRNSLKKLKPLNVAIDLTKREVMDWKSTSSLYIKERVSLIKNLFPPKYRRTIKSMLFRPGRR